VSPECQSSLLVSDNLTCPLDTWYAASAIASRVFHLTRGLLQAPETIAPDSTGHWREWDTKADIWSLGGSSFVLSGCRTNY
jgi:hypothetical protein